MGKTPSYWSRLLFSIAINYSPLPHLYNQKSALILTTLSHNGIISCKERVFVSRERASHILIILNPDYRQEFIQSIGNK